MEGHSAMRKLNRKGQLAFIAVLIMLALIWFGFRTQQDRFEFTILGGDRQAELVSAYAEPEFARIYVQQAAKQALFETAWLTNPGKPSECAFNTTEVSEQFNKTFDEIFTSYLILYAGNDPQLEATLPNYNTTINFAGSKATVNAFGRAESCESTVPFPPKLCLDQNATECQNVKFDDSSLACIWNLATEICEEARPQPDCGAAMAQDSQEARQQACEAISGCTYIITDADPVLIRQDQFLDYNFELQGSAYVRAEATCDEYKAYADQRGAKYLKPECTLNVEAKQVKDPTAFTVTYRSWDNQAPGELKIKLSGPISKDIDVLPKPPEPPFNDGNYQNEEKWRFMEALDKKGDYTAVLTCTPKYATVSSTDTKTFTVQE